jgi:hypothetical protein
MAHSLVQQHICEVIYTVRPVRIDASKGNVLLLAFNHYDGTGLDTQTTWDSYHSLGIWLMELFTR